MRRMKKSGKVSGGARSTSSPTKEHANSLPCSGYYFGRVKSRRRERGGGHTSAPLALLARKMLRVDGGEGAVAGPTGRLGALVLRSLAAFLAQ
ncbi:hypothetical protein MRX96_035123 [Rhipicephalus microplus]